MDNYWILAILTFLIIVSIKKYNCIDTLREWIEEYLAEITPKEIIEDDDVFEIEEIRDMIQDLIVRNPEIFSNINNRKDE
tara:strand:+ start:730 stop:969 length:240 start_codon:yes stop_codon:yes gene_type:complete